LAARNGIGRVEACELNGEIRAGFTQRLYLDTSRRNDWKIDIFNVDDLYAEDHPITHHIVGAP
jgi:hypothetical protein